MKGNPDKLDVDMEGRLARIVLSLRLMMILMISMILMIAMIAILANHDYVFFVQERGGNLQCGDISWIRFEQEGEQVEKNRNLMIVEKIRN